ncbi:MAG: sensor histidine kinase [Phocaeicola sp.]
MKTKILLLLFVSFYSFSIGQAQTDAPSPTARWQTFTQLSEKKQYQQAVEEGVKVSLSFTQEQRYQDAFATCRQLDALISNAEKETQKPQNELRYWVNKERLRMYTRLKNSEQANRLLQLLRTYVQELNTPSLLEDFWLTEANYYQQMGLTEKSLESYKQLFQYRTLDKTDSEKDSSYKEMLNYAETSNNASLAIAMRKLYTHWKDSIKGVEATKELQELALEKENTHKILEEKESKIKTQYLVIVVCCIVSGLLLAALLITWLSLAKKTIRCRKLRNRLITTEATNAQKSKLIRNIAAQFEPSLSMIEESTKQLMPANSSASQSIQALNKLVKDIETFIGVEERKDEPYPMQSISISSLCKEVMEQAQVQFKPGVTAVVNTPPHVMLKTNEEVVKRILLHLLRNASVHTTEGRITLEFKKRRADSGQFIVTDTGAGIAPEELETLFIPFSRVRDLLRGNALGLPICSLMAHRLNGALSVDTNYKKGARFIFELYA